MNLRFATFLSTALLLLAPLNLTAQESHVSENTSESSSLSFLFDGTAPTSLDQLRAMEQHLADLVKKVEPATVNIQVGQAQGSGVVVTRDGYILTAAHVIGGPDRVATIRFPDGKKVEALTLGVDSRVDSGMLKITDKGKWPYLDLGESTPLKQGQWVAAIGHPGGIDMDRGLVLRVGRMIWSSDTQLRTDCTLVGGDSGGPLVDMDGNLIGIHSRIGQRLTDNVHVPIDKYSEEWDLLAVGEPWVGFNLKGDSNEIRSITRNGPAFKSELKIGDWILKIDNQEINSKSDIGDAIRKLNPRDKVDFLIKRGDEELTIEVTIGWK